MKKKSWIDNDTESVALDYANNTDLRSIRYMSVPADGCNISITNHKNSWNLYECLNVFSLIINKIKTKTTFNITLKNENDIDKYLEWVELIKDDTKLNNITKAIEAEYSKQLAEFKKIRGIPSFLTIKKVKFEKLPKDLKECNNYYFCYTGDSGEEFICKTISSTVPNITLNSDETYQAVVQVRYNILSNDVTTYAYLNVVKHEKDKTYPQLQKTIWGKSFDILEDYMNYYVGKECIDYLDLYDTSKLPEDLIDELEILVVNGLD